MRGCLKICGEIRVAWLDVLESLDLSSAFLADDIDVHDVLELGRPSGVPPSFAGIGVPAVFL
jgi:hypothetical protein